ncbi:MAG: DinB family protein [Chitinophagaceae bacterium]|nr:DinB family protein [Chitinophagaceae bacterium]
MFKRRNGYILLTLLVITGLASQVSHTTISRKERKFLVNDLKETKSDLIKSVRGLSEAQLNFKPAPEKWSVKECVQHLASAEYILWSMAEAALKQPADAEKRKDVKVTDEQLIKMVRDRSNKVKTSEPFEPQNAKWKTAEEALDALKDKRADLIKYAKTTTDDLRNHVVQLPFGTIDTYQLLLMISSHSNRHTQQIEEVKADPNFPR